MVPANLLGVSGSFASGILPRIPGVAVIANGSPRSLFEDEGPKHTDLCQMFVKTPVECT